MQIRRLLLTGLLLAALPAFGHTLGETASETAAGALSFEPAVVLPLLLLTIAYISGICHLHQQRIRQRVVSWEQCAAFALGMLALVAALMSPLDVLAESLFSAHMTQHLMLMLVAPPLLILGRIEIVLLWTFSLPVRRLIGRSWRKATWLRSALNLLMRPVAVWLLASATMWFWHIPGPYAWAFYNPGIHILEHLSFFLTSLAFWALVMQPFRRDKRGHGTALVLLATFALESTILGALLAFAVYPLYTEHAISTSRHVPHFLTGISPLQDQQLAGLIMWVPASLIQLVALGAVFVDWLSASKNPRTMAI
ncbi:cytochrome c oxidase caa3 assembly factor (Caa3_CtaG) [mine drainage metagenome]|uniref:Cytochrome c oxidase caa3 assembly factor (Caa3_CtaG) n=1 Tax=mine drainage metagenome TaxID=410659 RepID=A0A1J5PR95_9ZZZZ